MLTVSTETDDRTAAESVRPSSENRHKTPRSDEMVERVVDIGAKAILRSDSRKSPDLG